MVPGLASPPSTASSYSPSTLNAPPPSTTFDIVAHYNKTAKADPDLPAPLAAIESLITLLKENPLTTIAETLALNEHQTTVLLSSQRNPIPLSAGTDLFQRYIISSFQARPSFLHHSDFSALRSHLISNSRLFIARAKLASGKIASHVLPFIKDDSTLFTYASTSPVIKAILTATSEQWRYTSVAHITSATCPTPPTIKSQSTETTNLPFHEVAYALSSLGVSQHNTTLFIFPAQAVLENGSVVAALGTHQLAILARAYGIPFYFVVESFKFVRSFPLGTGSSDLARMDVRQPTLQFADSEGQISGGREEKSRKGSQHAGPLTEEGEKVDITPADLITALITENGTMTPQAVSEELIKLWF
jgi:translation initiation factor eIF-2B subunit alpha